jgi:hypothetical protein
MATKTLCGYDLADVRRSFRDSVNRGDRRAAYRWTAELVATPGAVGSLWASYWLAWAAVAGGPSPTVPILIYQGWDAIVAAAHKHSGLWREFRNDPDVRAHAADTTTRLLDLPHQTPVIWPSKEIMLYDVATMRDTAPPVHADGPVVLAVWQRGEDSMELRMMAGRFLAALERGELRLALSAIAWSLLPAHTASGEVKVAARGPTALTPKQRTSPIWFWLELGRLLLNSRTGLHRGWPTAHRAIAEAFKTHWRRWTASDRLQVLLAWVLQMRAALQAEPHPESLWVARPFTLTLTEIDRPYQEIAAELAHPDAVLYMNDRDPTPPAVDSKKAAAERAEAKMAEADAKIMALLGLPTDDDA